MNQDELLALVERCAVLCEQYSEVNMEICGDTVMLDPLLRGKEWTPENVKASEGFQLQGMIHSAQHAAAQHLAHDIRSLAAQGD